MIIRYSSRRSRLDQAVLAQRLTRTISCDRIASYFRSSRFDVTGEAIARVTGPTRSRGQIAGLWAAHQQNASKALTSWRQSDRPRRTGGLLNDNPTIR